MKTQNYSNHTRWVPSYHFITYGVILFSIVATIYYFTSDSENSTLLFWIMLSNLFCIISIAFHARLFALKAQDRAIRSEEGLRYFILTGKRLDPKLRLGQIIALRFASDEEFVELVEKALKQNLSSKEIKKAIKNWRGDFHRV